ncbi:DUF6264 family protein [Microbacterium sp. GXF7504]
MSESRNDGEPAVFTMPPSAYRVGDGTPQSARAVPTPPPAASHPTAPETGTVDAGRPRLRLGDTIATVLLIVLGAAVAGVGSVMALFLAFASDGCASDGCAARIEVGMLTAMFTPWVLWFVGVVWAIVRVVRRRLAFWVPLAAAALGVAVWFLGAWIALSTLG